MHRAITAAVPPAAPRIAIVLPVCNEAECLPAVLAELQPWAILGNAVIAVGLNDCSDASAAIARSHGAIVGATSVRGYGHGCLAAMAAVRAHGVRPAAWIFMAADGAHDPAEIPRFLSAWHAGADLVLGQRTTIRLNWSRLGHVRALSNVLLALWASCLGRLFYADLGPYRLISDRLIRRLSLRETTWGWTIAPQVLAPALGVRVAQFSVTERPRLAGEQKVSQLGWRHSLRIGLAIAAAGWRASRTGGAALRLRAELARASEIGSVVQAPLTEAGRPDSFRCV